VTVVVDTSAVIAIMKAEPEAGAVADIIATAGAAIVSMATLFEMHCVTIRSQGGIEPSEMQMLLDKLELTPVPFDELQLNAARDAYARYGRGSRHAADLNMGDCFSYALAKTRNLPLLFKGDDFIHTDVEPALKPA
jgi:ribonuclease VapC